PFPFHVINNNQSMNVRPRHYEWPEFYDRLVDLTAYSFSWRAIGRRLAATNTFVPRWMNVVRGISSEGFGRTPYHRTIRHMLDVDRSVWKFMDAETDQIPEFYVSLIRRELGPVYDHLPEGAMNRGPNAFLKTVAAERSTVRLT